MFPCPPQKRPRTELMVAELDEDAAWEVRQVVAYRSVAVGYLLG